MGNFFSKLKPGRKGYLDVDTQQEGRTEEAHVIAQRAAAEIQAPRQAGANAVHKQQDERRRRMEEKKAAKKAKEDIPYADAEDSN